MNVKLSEVQDFTSVSGRGVKGKIEVKEYFAGNILFIKENNISLDKELLEKSNNLSKRGKTVIYFADKENVIGIIAVADTIKETSYRAIKELKNKNIEVVMLTGDNSVVAKSIGNELGIYKIISEVLPVDKEKEVSKLQEKEKRSHL